MRFEIVLILITIFLMANVYSDGKYLKMALSGKKYYQMAGIAFGAFVLYWLVKKNPMYAHKIISTSNEYLKYMPVDKNAAMVVSPILDFTAKHGFSNNSNMGSSYYNHPVASMPQVRPNAYSVGGAPKATKRSVSETKKKFVAASQNWHCGKCARQLPAWFEVDHKVRLEYGGSNQVDNLVALCRDCHGEKTALENL